jgi:formylglycine-generating enzyme required for sulfatase activity
MRLVEGLHHENVQRLCLDYRAGHCLAIFPGVVAREPRATPVRVCMDQYEWPNRAGAAPEVMMRFVDAEASCASVGKRLCTEFEWETACEGPDLLPWPYGWAYTPGICNSDKPYKPVSEAKLASNNVHVREAEARRAWQGAPSGSFPSCTSVHGVNDLTGNVEEWVTSSRPEWPYRSSLKGGYWSKPWSGCRGTNESHGPLFRFYEVGFRCCQDPRP